MNTLPVFNIPSYRELYQAYSAKFAAAKASAADEAASWTIADKYVRGSAVQKSADKNTPEKPKSLEDQINDYYSLVNRVNQAGKRVSDTPAAQTAADSSAQKAEKGTGSADTAKPAEKKELSLEDQIKSYYKMVDNINAAGTSIPKSQLNAVA